MPRGKDIAWKFVDGPEGGRWRCPYCEKKYKGTVTRVKSHFLEIPNKGSSFCAKVPQQIRELMKWLPDQVRNKEDIAWKFVERLGDDKWRCHHCKEEFSGDATRVKGHLLQVSNQGISICPKVPDTIRKLMPSLLEEAAEEESREANGQSSMEPQSRDLPSEAQAGVAEEESREGSGRFSMELQSCDMPTQAVVAEEESREACRQFFTEPRSCGETSLLTPGFCEYVGQLLITPLGPADSSNFNQQDVIGLNSDQQSQAECQFHQCSTMPSPVQNSHGESMSCSGEEECYLRNSPYHEERQMNDQQTPAGESSSQCEQSRAVGNSNCLQDCNRHPQLQTPMDIDPSIASQHTSDSHNSEPTAIDLQVSEPATNAMGPSSSQASVPPQRQSVPHQSITNETSNAQQNPTMSLSSCDIHLVPRLPADLRNVAPCIPSSSQAPNNAPPSPHIPPCGTGLIGPSSLPDMNRGSPIMISASDKEIRNLKRKMEYMDDQEADVKEQMEIESAASSDRKKPRILVERWLKKTQRARNNFQIIDRANAETLPPKEQVETWTKEVEELIGQTLPQPLLIEERDTKGVIFLVRKLTGEAIHRNIESIWDLLKENHAYKLGIHGMGGVGKTTIMMHIYNRLVKDATFDGVGFITVSQDFSIYKLQSDIWKALKFGVMEDKQEKERAAMLSEQLKRKKNCVLILDDVWEHLDLEEVGIPVTADGFKLVLTTRSLEVCRQMLCQEKLKIEPLSPKEAESLFFKELRSDVPLNLATEAVMKSIVEECAGLPLAVITMARSMRGVTDVFEWRDCLVKLKESNMRHTDMEKVLMILKFSYDRLGDPAVQQCLLSCALYPEAKFINKFELIEFFIDQGLIGGLDLRKEQYDRALTILTKLKNVCLLEAHGNIMKMHDLIRDMALHIMGATSMVKAGKWLTRIPLEEYWTDALEKVSLMKNEIGEFPLDMSPSCPKLSTLLLNNSLERVSVIPDAFFKQLGGLQVLNLSGNTLTELPNSISDLVKLRALLLRECWQLHHIPYVGKLTSLRKLDVQGCGSLEEIDGLKKLVNLRYLDLYRTGIKRLPKGTLGSLLKLQYIKVEAPIEVDIAKLAALETLECYFGDADGFNKWARVIGQSKRCRYNLTVKSYQSLFKVELSYDNPFGNRNRRVVIKGSYAIVSAGGECAGIFISIPQDVQSLTMQDCDGTANLAGMGPLHCLEVLVIRRGQSLRVLWGGPDEEVIDIHGSPATTPSPPLFPSLKFLEITGCSKLKYLLGYGSKFSLPHLREIKIHYCEEMVGIMATVTSPPTCPIPTFPNLEKISVSSCDKMKRVVESEWLPPNLRDIRVVYCENMEEIIGGPPPNMTVEEIPLESLHIWGCHKMRMLLTHEWLIHLRNLRRIHVNRCTEMVEMVSGAGQSREGSMISEAGQSHGGSIMTPVTNTSFRSSISLPRLTHLHLHNLPRLQSICEVLVTCDSIEDMTVDNCPELKTIHLQLRLHDDKDLPHILVEDEERWNTLTWEDIKTKIDLLPFLREVERSRWCPPAIELCPIGLDLK